MSHPAIAVPGAGQGPRDIGICPAESGGISMPAPGNVTDSAVASETGRVFPDWLALVGLVAIFWVYKLPDLTLPYFWDEVAVYARAALYLHDHTLGLLPADLPASLSRGHPLLLAFVFALSFRIFGATPLVAHVSMLVISTALLSSVWWMVRKRWSPRLAVVAAALLLVQPLFVAQSTLVLPEVPLALACLWTLYGCAEGKYGVTGLSLGIALFLKESALVLDLVVLATLCVRSLRGGMTLARWTPVVAANLLCAFFFLLQRWQNGWFLFPLHRGYVDFHWHVLRHWLWIAGHFLFVEQGRAALSLVLVLGLFAGLSRRSLPWAGLDVFVPLAVAFVVAMLVFSAGNVFMNRYLLCLLPPLAVLGSLALRALVGARAKAGVVLVAGLCLASLLRIASPGFNCEYDMGFRQAVKLQQQATTYVVEKVGPERAILGNFPACAGLEDPRFGYVPRRFARFMYEYTPAAEYVFASELFRRFEMPPGVHTDLVKRFVSPYMNIALYRIVH